MTCTEADTRDGIILSPPLMHRKEIWPLRSSEGVWGKPNWGLCDFKKKKILLQNNFLLSRNFTCKMLAVFRLLATPRIILRSYTHKSFYPDHSEDSWLLSVCSLLGRSVLLLMCVVPLLRTWFENLEVFLQVWLFPLSS